MKISVFIILLFCSFISFSQEKKIENQLITFDYAYQLPIGTLSESFGNNSSIGMTYLKNKSTFLYGIDVNFQFGNQVKNDSLFKLIATEDGLLINASGELDEVLLYERGFNSHLLFGKDLQVSKNIPSRIYLYGGIGYLQHKIRIESNRTDLPQISKDYIKGYDNFTNGISTKLCIKYMYFDKNTNIKLYLGSEFINAFTKNNRPYNFGEMELNNTDFKLEQIIGFNFGVIIPINRNNEEKFHYY